MRQLICILYKNSFLVSVSAAVVSGSLFNRSYTVGDGSDGGPRFVHMHFMPFKPVSLVCIT